jgi:O-antigen/teichoic acid export membrane protein
MLTARSLGAELFGVLVLIITYVDIVDRLINFQSGQAIVKFGADTLALERRDRFREVAAFCLAIDFLTAVLAAGLAFLCAPLFGMLFTWSEETVALTQLYALVCFLHLRGAPSGILRLLEEVRSLATISVFAQAIKLVAVSVAIGTGFSFSMFLLAWALSDLAGSVALLVVAWIKGRRLILVPGFDDLRRSIHSGRLELLRFVIFTNLNSSLRMASRQLDFPIVGFVLGEQATGVYAFAKNLASIPGRLTDPLYLAIYPILSNLFAVGASVQFRALALKASLSAGFVGLAVFGVIYSAGEQLIFLTAGADYSGSYPVLCWLAAAAVVAMFALPLQPCALAQGRPGVTFVCHVWSTIAYFSALIPFLHVFGLVGAGASYFFYYVVWSGLMAYYLARGSAHTLAAAE